MKKTLCLLLAVSGFISADEIQNDLLLVFSEDFEKGFQRRELVEPKGWTHSSTPFLPHGFRQSPVSATFPPKANS